ncbi:MAG: hypothetical protein M3N43_05855 [Actinomycetota bacterium]|nr:hypothetical protein [Actinomycetota bacterium]
MTPRELGGWVAEERHDHFDAEGKPTGHTIVTRESRIDDNDLGELLALAQYEAEVCSCGFHPLIARDKSNYFTPEAQTCPVCAGQAQSDRMQHSRDKGHESDPPSAPRPSDGRKVFMRLLTQEQVEAERAKRAR